MKIKNLNHLNSKENVISVAIIKAWEITNLPRIIGCFESKIIKNVNVNKVVNRYFIIDIKIIFCKFLNLGNYLFKICNFMFYLNYEIIYDEIDILFYIYCSYKIFF